MRTQVGIIGAGPAGLLLAHLLHLRGIESVVLDLRTRADIERTVRAGVLEQGTVDLLTATGVGDRLRREGAVHHGINLAFGGGLHRIDLSAASGGRAVTVYAQHEVLKDLIARCLADGGDLRFGVTGTTVEGVDGRLDGDRPTIRFTHEGRPEALECDFVLGAEGSRTYCRSLVADRTDLFRRYPFAWFGILAEAPPSSDELIYAHSDRGFALISTRSPTVQRLYSQCDPATDVDDWSDDRTGRSCRPGWPPPGPRCRRGRSSARTCCSSARSCASRCSTGGCSSPATPRTPSRRRAPRGSTWPWRARPGAGRLLRHQGHRAAGVVHRDGAAAGVAGPALLLVDDLDAAPVPRRAGSHGVRRAPPARRAADGGRLAVGGEDPRRQLRGAAAVVTAEDVERAARPT